MDTAAAAVPQPIPELVLLDINMPLVNGWEFLDQFQSLPEPLRSKITIVMLSTSLRDADVERMQDFPFVHSFVHKPLTKEKAEQLLAGFQEGVAQQ